ncbi:MAG: hypothetical protein RJB43_959, partial [Verrucomicrobiota bacterium]
GVSVGEPEPEMMSAVEMTEPHLRFKKYNVRNTIVMFGSARTLPPDVARKRLKEAKAVAASGKCDDAECAHRVRVAEIDLRSSAYYEACRELSFENDEVVAPTPGVATLPHLLRRRSRYHGGRQPRRA